MAHFYLGFYGFDYYRIWLIQLGFGLSLTCAERFQYKLPSAAGIRVTSSFGKKTFVRGTLDAAVGTLAPETKFI